MTIAGTIGGDYNQLDYETFGNIFLWISLNINVKWYFSQYGISFIISLSVSRFIFTSSVRLCICFFILYSLYIAICNCKIFEVSESVWFSHNHILRINSSSRFAVCSAWKTPRCMQWKLFRLAAILFVHSCFSVCVCVFVSLLHVLQTYLIKMQRQQQQQWQLK